MTAEMTNEGELLPCPFCGATLERNRAFSNRTADMFIHPANGCVIDNTRVIVPLTKSDLARSSVADEWSRVVAWNRRPSTPATAGTEEPDEIREAIFRVVYGDLCLSFANKASVEQIDEAANYIARNVWSQAQALRPSVPTGGVTEEPSIGRTLAMIARPADLEEKDWKGWDLAIQAMIRAHREALRAALQSSPSQQPGTIEELIVAAYVRGVEWGEENPLDREYRFKAARDYADKILSQAAENGR